MSDHNKVKAGNSFATNKDRLIEDYHSGHHSVLPEWE